MKKTLILTLFILLVGSIPAKAGMLYEDTIIPLIATNMKTNDITTLKQGKAQIMHCLGIIDAGHAGIQKAAQRAGITQIHHVDVKTRMVLGIGMTTVMVYGE